MRPSPRHRADCGRALDSRPRPRSRRPGASPRTRTRPTRSRAMRRPRSASPATTARTSPATRTCTRGFATGGWARRSSIATRPRSSRCRPTSPPGATRAGRTSTSSSAGSCSTSSRRSTPGCAASCWRRSRRGRSRPSATPVAERARALLAPARERGSVDLVDDYAQAFSLGIICDLIGVAPDDRETIKRLSDDTVAMYEPGADDAHASPGQRGRGRLPRVPARRHRATGAPPGATTSSPRCSRPPSTASG